jgi:hypothetical protein
MRRPHFAAFGHGSRSNQHVLGYVMEYAATEHAIFSPYEYIRFQAVFGWLLIFDRGK